MRTGYVRNPMWLLIALAISVGGVSGVHASEIPLTINGEINCAHPDNAITITCRGANPAPAGDSNPPPPAPVPTVAPQAPAEPAPAGGTITYSGDSAINCSLPENAGNTRCLPMTNPDGSINCQQADNAITTTCWERSQAMKQAGATSTEIDCSLDRFKDYPACTGVKPQAVIDQEQAQANRVPVPTVTPQLPTEAPPPGVTITYSGDTAINCALPENKENNICLPMTNPDGSINCQQADNAITTTCWERGLAEKLAGPTVTPEVDCTLDRFKSYPVCTGIKPEAVVVQEQASQATSNTTEPVSEPKPAEVKSESGSAATESATAPAESGAPQTSSPTDETQAPAEELRVAGSISLKSLGAKSTVLNLELSSGGLTFRVVATKKGSPTITRELSIDEDGERTIKFARNLKGYTIRVLVNGEEIDRVRA